MSLSTIRQKEHLAETVGSNAFNRLFNGRPLLRSKYKKFLISLWIQAEFHRPKHFLSWMRGGTGTLARFEKVKTVLKFTGSAALTAWFSSTDLNFLEPFTILLIKVETDSHKLSESSSFLSLFLAERRAVWSRSQQAAVSGTPPVRNSLMLFSLLPRKQSQNFSARILLFISALILGLAKKAASRSWAVSGPLENAGLLKIYASL